MKTTVDSDFTPLLCLPIFFKALFFLVYLDIVSLDNVSSANYSSIEKWKEEAEMCATLERIMAREDGLEKGRGDRKHHSV